MNNKLKIGIAEDHELMRSAIKFCLLKNNCSVIIEAKNGDDLIMKIQKASEKPEICIVDANMPVLGGCETVVILKEKNPEIKIIAYSDDLDKGREMVKRGADVYLPKNSSEESILKCISKLVEQGA
jgi:two-component system, NarL family, invasion response regulator UvrY